MCKVTGHITSSVISVSHTYHTSIKRGHLANPATLLSPKVSSIEGFHCTCSCMHIYMYMCLLSRYNDPPYVKVKKLEVLTEVCNVENAQYIVDELG